VSASSVDQLYSYDKVIVEIGEGGKEGRRDRREREGTDEGTTQLQDGEEREAERTEV
jgi:hypothetical protein